MRESERLGRIAGLEVRFVEAGEADGETDGTRLFSALGAALADVPPDRVAGAIFITDGRVHDVPAEVGFNAPVHALITGRRDERDRRVALMTAPRFGLVGQSQTIVFRVEDQGARGGTARISVRRDGETVENRTVVVGNTVSVQIPIPHAGPNIVEVEASPLEGELTTLNNRVVVSIDGVREKLRVLLVSGEPHAGERTWRNLLKADASVDLVHFTILRPPEKQDGTPINELSLIAFPTRELFQQKIGEFQLIIFDRYARQGVLPMLYFDNIARYVREGGAVLIAAGPDYASPTSLWRTPLDAILPAEPSGRTTEQPFYAQLTDLGKRHPVTRGLEGSASDPPNWSRWFRLVDTKNATGTTVLDGPDHKPLLVISREGEGRVALLLSDHIWLWARGYEGGGPHLDLLRRLSHWLMKQPDLEEEALRLVVRGRGLRAIIAGAGGAAHLAGVVAAKTLLPVIGVPVQSASLNGLDSLLSIVQMPKGVPVATVAIGPSGAANAGLLAVVTIDADVDLHDAFALFRTHAMRRLAVVRGGQFVGMITVDDLLVDVAADLHDLSRPVAAEVLAAQHDSPLPATT